MWFHFTSFVDSDRNKKAKCNYCDRDYFSDTSKNGTTSLKKHMTACTKLTLSGESKQT